jgi:hypothetical protein
MVMAASALDAIPANVMFFVTLSPFGRTRWALTEGSRGALGRSLETFGGDGLMESAADRVAALERVFDAEVYQAPVSTRG